MKKALYGQHLQYLKQQNIKKQHLMNGSLLDSYFRKLKAYLYIYSIISVTGDTCRYYHNQSETIQH